MINRCAGALSVVVYSAILASCSDAGRLPTDSRANASNASGNNQDVDIAVAFWDSIGAADRAYIAAFTPGPPRYVFRGFPAMVVRAPEQLKTVLRDNGRVRFVETGLPIRPMQEVSGWHFPAVPLGHGIQQVHNDVAFGDARFGATIGVAVIGTGINCYGVSDFLYGSGSAGCAGGQDFTGEGTPFLDVYGPTGHETRVASIILAATGNGIQIRGITPRVVLYSLRIFNSQGFGTCILSAMAIDYATYDLSTVVSVINASYGSPATTAQQRADYGQACQSEIWAVANAVNSGRFISASAGNITGAYPSDSVHYPARLPGVAAVSGLSCPLGSAAACFVTPTFWTGSSRGAQVAFAASAVNMYTVNRNNAVMTSNGTSFAAPVVSAIVAAVQSRYNIPRTGACLLQHLKNTAHTQGGWNPLFYGAGMVNAYAAWSSSPGDPVECIPGPE